MPKEDDIWKAVIPAIKEGRRTSYKILPIKSTSTPKIEPAIGVPNTASNPALIPQITSFLLSSFPNLNKSANKDERPPPICAQGPSFSTEPPAASVIIHICSKYLAN